MTWTLTTDNDEQKARKAWVLQLTGGSPDTEFTALRTALGDEAGPIVETVENAARERARLAQRQSMLDVLRLRVRHLTEQFEDLTDAQVSTLKGMKNLVNKGGDVTKSFGTYNKNTISLETEDETKAYWAIYERLATEAVGLVRLKDTMVGAWFTYGEEDLPLFDSDAEVEQELYTPVVRQLLFPEDQVPDSFSAVQQMIDRTNEVYLKQLEGLASDKNAKTSRNLAMAKEAISALAKVGMASAGMAGAVDPYGAADGVKAAKTAITVTEAILNASLSGADAFLKNDGFSASSSIIDGVADSLGAILKAALPSDLDSPSGKEIAKYVSLSIKATKIVPDIAKQLTGPSTADEKVGNIIASVQKAIIGSLDFFCVEGSSSDKQALGIEKTVLTALVDAQVRALKPGGMAEKVRRGDRKGLIADFVDLGADVAQAVLTEVGKAHLANQKEVVKTELEQLHAKVEGIRDPEKRAEFLSSCDNVHYTNYLRSVNVLSSDGSSYDKDNWKDVKIDKCVSGAQTLMQSSFDGASKASGKSTKDVSSSIGALITGAKSPIDKETLDKKMAEHLADAERQDAEILQKSRESFRRQLEGVSELPLDKLAEMTAQLQRDKMVLDLMFNLGSGGFKAAAMFFAPLAAAGTLGDLIKVSKEAAAHQKEAALWAENFDLSKNAVSPYHTSAINFMKTEKRLFKQATTKAVFTGIQFAAEVAAAAGGPTPVGAAAKLVAATTSAISTAEEIIFEAVDESRLNDAWKVTKRALANPKDRLSALEARQLNPTLAKYSLAYGAMIQKDVVCMELMNTIGLSEQTLLRPNDKADEALDALLGYLNARYDHKTLLRPLDSETTPWVKKLPTRDVRARNWAGVVAVARAEGDLAPGGTRNVEVALNALRPVRRTIEEWEPALASEHSLLESGESVDDQLWRDRIIESGRRFRPAIDQVIVALETYSPVHATGGGPHDEMQSLCADFLASAKAFRARLNSLEGDITTFINAVDKQPEVDLDSILTSAERVVGAAVSTGT